MKTTGWAAFRQTPRPPKREYSPPAGKGLDGVDRAKLDELELQRRMDLELKEVWEDD